MASKERKPIAGEIPDWNTPWDDGTSAYTTGQVRRFLKREVEALNPDEQLDEYSPRPVANRVVAQAIGEIADNTVNDSSVVANDDGTIRVNLLNKENDVITYFDVPAGGGGEVKSINMAMSFNRAAIKTGDVAEVIYTYDYVLVGGANSGESAGISAKITVSVIRNGVTVWSSTETKAAGGTYRCDITEAMRGGTADVTVTAEVNDPEYETPRTTSRTKRLTVSTLELSSSFDMGECTADGGLSGESAVRIPYRVDGTGTKTVRCLVNGTQTATQTVSKSGDNGQFSVSIADFNAGETVCVDIYADSVVEDVTFYSELIHIDLVKSPMSGNWVGVKYSTAYDGESISAGVLPTLRARQYEDFAIGYTAYNSASPTTNVTITVNGVPQTVTCERAEQTYRYGYSTHGTDTITFTVEGMTRTVGVEVERASVDININQSYTYELTAAGRSNNDIDLDPWGAQTGITTQYEGVDWATSGWTGESLKLINGAKATVGIKPFAAEPKTKGMTLELVVKISNPTDKTQNVITSCVGQKGLFVTGEQIMYKTGITTTYTDEEGETQTRDVGLKTNYQVGEQYMLISFVVGKQGVRETMELYVDGDRVAADKYVAAYNFTLGSSAPGITFDSTYADVEIKKIRLYELALDDDLIVDNAIAERGSASEMLEMYNVNDVLDEHSDISMDTLLANGKGVVLLVHDNTQKDVYGDGPIDDIFGTNDKKVDFVCDVYYTPSAQAQRNGAQTLELHNNYVRIQGTSSTKYPAKNLRIYINKGAAGYSCTIGGENVPKSEAAYRLADGVHEQTVLCAKKDFSDSSMSLNTGGAKMFNDVFKELDLLTPPQRYQKEHGGNITARAAIYGLPIDVFVAASVEDTPTYLGQYNLNNEKSKSGAIFGMTGVDGFTPECPLAFETLNNTKPMCLFQCEGDTAEEIETWMGTKENPSDSKSKTNFDVALEVNYSNHGSDGDIGWADMTEVERAAVVRLWSWVKSCVPEGADPTDLSTWVSQKFVDEVEDYFDVDYLQTYYLWTDYFIAVDQRGKNILWRTWDGLKWYPTYYDGDTQMGKCNESYLKYPYSVTRDTWDAQFRRYVFEGHDSWLWCLTLANLSGRMRTCAERLRAVLTNARVMQMYAVEQMGNWSVRAYNKSSYKAYIRPFLETTYGQIWPYIYACQGRNLPHRQYMVANRFAVCDAKYGCGGFINDNIDVGISQPQDGTASIRVRLTEDYAVGYGTNNNPFEWISDVTGGDRDIDITISGYRSGTDPIRLYGASRIKVLDASGANGHLSNTVNLIKCVNLQTLDLSVPENGTVSTGWFMNVAGCRQIKTIDLSGQTYACTGQEGSGVLDFKDQVRLETLDCSGVVASTLVLAEGAPITELSTPYGLTSLKFVNLPQLTNDGLTINDLSNVTTLEIRGCARLDTAAIVRQWIDEATDKQSLTVDGVDWELEDDGLLAALLGVPTVELSGTIRVPGLMTDVKEQVLAKFGPGVLTVGNRPLYIDAPSEIIITTRSNAPLMAFMYAAGWAAHESYMTLAEAQSVGLNSQGQHVGITTNNDIGLARGGRGGTSILAEAAAVVNFDEFQHFVNASIGPGTKLCKGFFNGFSNLRRVTIPAIREFGNLNDYPMTGYISGCMERIAFVSFPKAEQGQTQIKTEAKKWVMSWGLDAEEIDFGSTFTFGVDSYGIGNSFKHLRTIIFRSPTPPTIYVGSNVSNGGNILFQGANSSEYPGMNATGDKRIYVPRGSLNDYTNKIYTTKGSVDYWGFIFTEFDID